MLITVAMSPMQLRLHRMGLDALYKSERSRLRRLEKVRSKRVHRVAEQLAEIRAEFLRIGRQEAEFRR